MTGHELILGGQRSGKTQMAEARAIDWLHDEQHEVCVIATATLSDDDMCARIERHRAIRARTMPRAVCIEEPRELAQVIGAQSAPHRLLLVDCLTLWATNLLAPSVVGMDLAALGHPAWQQACLDLRSALMAAAGPVILVSGEIGLGCPPDSSAASDFVSAMGELHQAVAGACTRVTWAMAGQAIVVKG